ncbi:hypothetical protein [Paraliomyxa miuraensis]|uniref:hypothetical protein n=1 Tax=Paraliomyxa miuraensis TaxID=376150 RepID=UPI002257482E|nr:hypothetical protein [Paraliomyxa miuraensis]MCX4247431.1 hypothetical protein [Paraliomyxa miuraensis]
MILFRADQVLSICEPNYTALIEHVCRHLRELHGHVTVTCPDETTTIAALSDPVLHELVRKSLVCALDHGIAEAPVLSAFIVTRFVAAPNFTEHPAARTWLEDASMRPDDRVRQLVQRLTPRDWRDIRRSYRAEGWQS